MKRLILFLLLASAAFGQMSSTGSISASGANCFTTNACISLHLINSVNASTANATVTIAGSFTGTLQFEASADNGVTFVGITGTPVPSGAGVTSATAAGVWTFSIAAFTDFRVRASAFSANSATVTIQSSTIAQTVTNNITQGGAGLPTGSVVNGVVQSGLLAQYAFTDNAGATLTDSSGSGNNGTLCAAGAAPTWVGAPTGGLTFAAASSQCVTLTSALNAAATIQIFANTQPTVFSGSQTFPCIIAGNGTKANTAALCQSESGSGGGFSNSGTFSVPIESSRVGGSTNKVATISAVIGTGLVTWVLDASVDTIWNGSTQLTTTTSGGSAGAQTSGVYQFGGLAANYVNSNSSFWSGTMYYALFYNRKLSAAEISQNNAAINQIMVNRNLTFTGSTLTSNVYVIDGDSLPGANGAWLQYAFPSASDGAWQAFYTGVSGWGITNLITNGPIRDDMFLPNAPGQGNAVLNVQIGTNNLGGSLATFIQQYAMFIQQRRKAGWQQVWINTILSNSATAAKNNFNTAIRQSWQTMGATGIIDIGGDPNIGCDACNTGAFFNVDHIHPNAVGQYEIAHIQQPNINRATNGNFFFTNANTYTTTAPAATTITAATESTNTVTLTFGATPGSFVPGVDLTISGVTPAGYNTSASNVCHILTATGTQITCLNPTSGLGAGSVFGTASTPMQLDVDATVILAGAATTPSFTLQSCASWLGGANLPGWDGRVRIKNANTTSPWTITPFGAETIDSAATLAMPTATSGNNPVVILEAQLVSSSAGGCNWRRLQ